MLPKVVKQNESHELFMIMYVIVNGIIIICVCVVHHTDHTTSCHVFMSMKLRSVYSCAVAVVLNFSYSTEST